MYLLLLITALGAGAYLGWRYEAKITKAVARI